MSECWVKVGCNSELVEADECSFVALELTFDGVPCGDTQIIPLQNPDGSRNGVFLTEEE